MKNELILCDCFGVVMNEMAPQWLSKYFTPEEVASIKPKYFDPVDLGEVTIWDTFDIMAKDLGLSRERVGEEWNAFEGVREDTVAMLRKLKEQYHIALLSNASKNLVEGYLAKYGIEDCFEKVLISANVGIKKPDPKFYRMCIDMFDQKFDKIYMIDDNEENLHPEGIELTGILFRQAEDLKVLL